MKHWFFVLCLGLVVSLFSPVPALAQNKGPVNAGFVSGVWYSQMPFFAGDQIRIYAAIQNRSGFDIKGQVQFFNHKDLIGQADFSALNGRLIEAWTDWKVAEGHHSIYAIIAKAERSAPGQAAEPIELASDSSPRNEVFADLDTDKDRIGNRDDLDDDNDGLPDKIESEQGSDPLSRDTDQDGLDDGEDPEPLLATTTREKEKGTAESLIKPEIEANSYLEKVAKAYNLAKQRIEPVVKPIIEKVNEWADEQKEKIEARKQALRQEVGAVSGAGGGTNLLAGSAPKPKPALQKADTNNDNKVDILDFNALMVNWERREKNNLADFNDDGQVNLLDFNLLMIHWTG